ncbi:hypothetical protein [Bradyrhizobium erythrophlei]|jgi:hypothetical protein|uniref:Uncharacterized protein n=1 Tax=Bradyrhizobium erythrophlei TaxID=1437360 RepID=A0A1M5IEE4_9BRAD|nr:hypothetical protein [Bradyrhizobium erythrophlei]SHG26627.1 hypothetical protein SAMN05443248_0942 [Bradyrhizobium erythrophlei]
MIAKTACIVTCRCANAYLDWSLRPCVQRIYDSLTLAKAVGFQQRNELLNNVVGREWGLALA